MSNTFVTLEEHAGIAQLTLNRPNVLNALSRAMFESLRDDLAKISANRNIGAVVLTGTGRAFCAGADLKDPMMGRDLPRAERRRNSAQMLDTLIHASIRDLRALPVPTVAAVNGIAAGGGVGLALACDIVIAAQSASFLLPFTPKLGLVPDLGSSWHLAHHLGRARALGAALLGDPVPARQAAEWGLVWRCVEDERLREEAIAIAGRLRDGPRRAQLALRKLIDEARARSFDAQLDAERDTQAELSETQDAAEALAAFEAKRAPRFTGK